MPYGTTLMGIYGSGGGRPFEPITYLGTGTSQKVLTAQRLGVGAFLWLKSYELGDHYLFSSSQGANLSLSSNLDAGQTANSTILESFDGAGFTVGTSTACNTLSTRYMGWSFVTRAGFLDEFVATGDGNSTQTLTHKAGSVGLILGKDLSSGDWYVFHRSLGASQYMLLNSATSSIVDTAAWGGVSPTSTEFTVGSALNVSGRSYLFRVFAHGTPTTSSFTFATDSNGDATISGLAYQPRAALIKLNSAGVGGSWLMIDEAKGWGPTTSTILTANGSGGDEQSDIGAPTSDGFTFKGESSSQYIATVWG